MDEKTPDKETPEEESPPTLEELERQYPLLFEGRPPKGHFY